MSKNKNKNHNQTMVSNSQKRSYTVDSNQNPVPTHLHTQLLYVDTVGLSLPVGPGFAEYQFSLNSLFDPNVTSGGHQPKGFDQLSALYQRYRVYKTEYEVFVQPVAIDLPPKLCSVVGTNSATAFANQGAAAEAYDSKIDVATNTKPAYMAGIVDLPKLNGKTLAQYSADDQTQALINTDPVEILILHVDVTNLTGLAESVNIYIKLKYHCEFFDPIQLGQS
jgi:hypothetical protein